MGLYLIMSESTKVCNVEHHRFNKSGPRGALVVIHNEGGDIKWVTNEIKMDSKVREVKRVVGQKVHQDSGDNGSH